MPVVTCLIIRQSESASAQGHAAMDCQISVIDLMMHRISKAMYFEHCISMATITHLLYGGELWCYYACLET